jgi:ParB-like chromosome segregation protein Spo0J
MARRRSAKTTAPVSNAIEEAFKRENITTQRMDIAIRDLQWDAKTYSFRDAAKLTDAAIKSLADSIREAGVLLVPPLVKRIDAGFLVIDGHRRKLALELLAKDPACADWTGDSLIPANVIVNEVSELELKLAGASANLDREELSQTERSRCAVSLRNSGAPKSEIMRRLNIKESQLERDLLVGNTLWVLKAIEEHCITHTIASRLLAVAEKYKRMDEFRDEFTRWKKEIRKALRKKNEERRSNDQDELTGEKLWPQRYLKGAQVEAWADALKTGRPFVPPSFKFKALIAKTEGGIEKVQIDSLNVPVAELSVGDAAKVYQRLVDLSEQLEPILLAKKQEQRKSGGAESKPSKGAERLAALGLEAFAGDEEEGIDGDEDDLLGDAIERDEFDAADSIEFPDDEQAKGE